MRFGLRLLQRQIPELGKWSTVKGNYDDGKHILPPKIRENEREEAIEELWREAKNEMWLVRHKRRGAPKRLNPRMSFQRKTTEKSAMDALRIHHEMALGPDITYEDCFVNDRNSIIHGI